MQSTATQNISPSINNSRFAQRRFQFFLKQSRFDYDDDEEEEHDDDDMIDPDSLGDWRTFRRALSSQEEVLQAEAAGGIQKATMAPRSVSKENEQVLMSQNQQLGQEYIQGVWAHEISTVGSSYVLV